MTDEQKKMALITVLTNKDLQLVKEILKTESTCKTCSYDYLNFCKSVIWYLNHGIVPASLTPSDFQKLKPVIDSLISKDTLDRKYLEDFN